ncbi:MAG: alpha/beta hydrolase [Pseudomonadota bacterium]
MSEPRELQLAGRVRMAAVASGPEDGPPVLAVHGWLDNAGTFDELMPRLRQAHIVALDLPGHGRSDTLPPGMNYHFLDHLQDIRDATRDLGWKRLRLVGHSMGGALSLAYAAAFPEQIQSVVAIDAIGPISDHVEHTANRIRAALLQRDGAASSGREFDSFDAAVAARRADGNLSEAGARALAERGVVREDGGWRWSADRRHRWPSIHRMSEPQVAALLAAIQAPVLALRAADSQFKMDEGLAESRLAAIANVTVRQVSGRHHVHLDAPDACADEIRAFWTVDGG